MLAVVPMDAGRSCGLLSTNGSIMDAARAWVPHASTTTAFVGAERQTASPITPNLPGPRGSLAARRRQTQAPHRRHGRNVARESTGWKATASSGGTGGGSSVLAQAASSDGVARPRGARGDCVIAASNNIRQRSQERAPPVEDASSIRSLRRSRGRGNSTGGAMSGTPGCGEAWGADTTVATVRTPSDRGHSGGNCSSRGGGVSNGAEVWAWAGPGGGAARGKAMLSAYGLQTDKQQNPACPRGSAADCAVRHGRWQRGEHEGSGARKRDAGSGSVGSVGDEDDRGKSGGGEGDNSSAGQSRRGSGGGGGCRGSDKLYHEGASAGHVQRFRGGKVRQKRPSAAGHGRSAGVANRQSSQDGASSRGGGGGAGDGAPDRGGGQTSALTVAAPECPPDGQVGASLKATVSSEETPSGTADLRSADQIQRALEDLLVPRRGSTASSHPSCCSGTTLGAAAGIDPAKATNKERVAILTMDGRGGSAAPPHRPQLSLKGPASASHASVLPDLATGVGIGATAAPPRGGEVSEADNGSGSVISFGEEGGGGGGDGGDDHSTPPVSRQRSHAHHSPWQARKHPRGFSRGRGGAGFGRHHHRHHHHHHATQERPLPEERPSSGSATARLSSCFSSESTERAPPVFSSPSTSLAESEAPGPPQHTTVCVVAAAARGQQGSNPFDRLLHPHHHGEDEPSSLATGAITASPRCELIDHFKLATRPTSRRGTRKQGDGEGGGGECTPEPAFCLFGRGGVGAGRARGPEEEEERRSRSSAKDFDRH